MHLNAPSLDRLYTDLSAQPLSKNLSKTLCVAASRIGCRALTQPKPSARLLHRAQRMRDPVILLCSGQTYEREAITRWLGSKRTDPLSNKRICCTRLVPNHSLRNAIEEEQSDIVKCATPHQCPFMCDRNNGVAMSPDREAATSCLCAFAVLVTVIAVYVCLAFLALFQRTALIGTVASPSLRPSPFPFNFSPASSSLFSSPEQR
jgi:hypothetical protein